MFQSPESGKFVSNCRMTKRLERGAKVFQSPRSGKFVSDTYAIAIIALATVIIGFNPLDRGNLYLIGMTNNYMTVLALAFQSPRSGKFVSD